MRKTGPIVVRSAEELAEAIGLPATAGQEFVVREQLLRRIVLEVGRHKLTHAQVAAAAGTSRPRVTAILNGRLDGVSTDLLLRMIGSLGVQVGLTFARIRPAA